MGIKFHSKGGGGGTEKVVSRGADRKDNITTSAADGPTVRVQLIPDQDQWRTHLKTEILILSFKKTPEIFVPLEDSAI
jgi:hypothetical protein